ncbi:MAG: Caffeoyl-CoA O-methyltransferase(), partial [uncultured Solirubrobacterales bacterium]
ERHRPPRGRALRGGAHHPAAAAPSRAGRGDVPEPLLAADDDRAGRGQVTRAAGVRERRAPRARDRDLQRVLLALHGRRSSRRRTYRLLRDRSRGRGGRARLYRLEPVRGPDRDPGRPGSGHGGRARRALRPGLHRRRQGVLSRLPRGGPAQARRARRHRLRQHALEWPRGRRGPARRAHARADRAERRAALGSARGLRTAHGPRRDHPGAPGSGRDV